MDIAICENCCKDMEKTELILEKLLGKDSQYDAFFSGQELLDYKSINSVSYNLYLLDIDMENMDGLSLAKRIRKTDSKALIVFITGFSNYVYDVFDVVTFDFILKPITEEKMKKMLNKAINYLCLTKKNFRFSYRQNFVSLNCEEILYIEKKGRQAFVHTENEDAIYKTNMTMADIWLQLDEHVFAQIDSSTIVNLEYVKKIDKCELILQNGKNMYISRVYKSSLKIKHLNYIKGKM